MSTRAALAAVLLAGACTRRSPDAAATPPRDPLAGLRTFEEQRRAGAHFIDTVPQDRAFGADPYDLVALDDGRVAGILRGADALVVLDDELGTLARVATPRSPSAIAAYRGPDRGELHHGDLLVASEIEPAIAHYRGSASAIERLADIPLDGALAVRDLATGPEGVVYAIEEHDDRLITLHFGAGGAPRRVERRVGRGPLRMVRTGRALVLTTLIDHGLEAYEVDAHGDVAEPVATARLDGPLWGLDAIDEGKGDGVFIVAGGVEDHPLDRTGGFFGYVDSYVYTYRFAPQRRALDRIAALDVGEHGLIVPKAIALSRSASGRPTALVTSYGAPAWLSLYWDGDGDGDGADGIDAPPRLQPRPGLPGASAIAKTAAGFVVADPLLDAWIALAGAGDAAPRVVHVAGDDVRTEGERLGEALFFTGLMAPTASADGPKSRFSCETCHFEGYVDGRTHHTGRGDVRATTKPLVGLFNNRPHFSRALDPDLSAVAENEFRVAGAPSAADPHFELDPKDVPWLAELGIGARRRAATELRIDLMSFLMKWTHRTNPRATRRAFTDVERRGEIAFADRCERCHQARTAADDPGSRLPRDRWEELILHGGPIVWASDGYEKTGVVPYVHEHGARVPSLRRLYKKRPYFTNGSAPDIATILRRARFTEGGFSHAEGAGEALDEPTVTEIAAFLDLF